MPENLLLDTARVEIKLGDYGVAPAAALADPGLLPLVQDYRRQTGSRMVPLDRDDVGRKIPAAEYHVSRKVDGEFTVQFSRQNDKETPGFQNQARDRPLHDHIRLCQCKQRQLGQPDNALIVEIQPRTAVRIRLHLRAGIHLLHLHSRRPLVAGVSATLDAVL